MRNVFLAGNEVGDFYLFAKNVAGEVVNLVDNIEKADIIHAPAWQFLLNIDRESLSKKVVYAHIQDDVKKMLTKPEYLSIAPFVNCWIVSTLSAKQKCELLSLPVKYIPNHIDSETYFKITDLEAVNKIKAKYNLPLDKYLLGKFNLEDKEWGECSFNGADVFLEIVKRVCGLSNRAHVVLVSKKTSLLVKKLSHYAIPYTLIDKENVETLNELYNALDLYIVSDRIGRASREILECVATKTKIVSSDVPQARDLLHSDLIYRDILEAQQIIAKDIKLSFLTKFVDDSCERLVKYKFDKVTGLYKELYENDFEVPQDILKIYKDISFERKEYPSLLEKLFSRKGSLTVHCQLHRPPWGGGNQFLLALSKSIEKLKWKVKQSLEVDSDIILFNSFLIDFEKLRKVDTSSKLMIHRLDGPISLVRGKDREIDDDIFDLNNNISKVTIFQSNWSLFETLKLGYKPVNPLLISNACDKRIFNKKGKSKTLKKGKVKIISTSWSSNPRKGGPVYKWLDDNLDFTRFEYTFVGRISEDLKNIKVIDAVPSKTLAKIIKKHDIYLTASDFDPCSNALIEALSCGLPSIYYNRGGHPEITGFGGFGFDRKEEIPALLEKLAENYTSIQNLIQVNDIDDIAIKYLEVIEKSYLAE